MRWALIQEIVDDERCIRCAKDNYRCQYFQFPSEYEDEDGKKVRRKPDHAHSTCRRCFGHSKKCERTFKISRDAVIPGEFEREEIDAAVEQVNSKVCLFVTDCHQAQMVTYRDR